MTPRPGATCSSGAPARRPQRQQLFPDSGYARTWWLSLPAGPTRRPSPLAHAGSLRLGHEKVEHRPGQARLGRSDEGRPLRGPSAPCLGRSAFPPLQKEVSSPSRPTPSAEPGVRSHASDKPQFAVSCNRVQGRLGLKEEFVLTGRGSVGTNACTHPGCTAPSSQTWAASRVFSDEHRVQCSKKDPASGRAVCRRAHFIGTELKFLSWSKRGIIFLNKKPIRAELCWGSRLWDT